MADVEIKVGMDTSGVEAGTRVINRNIDDIAGKAGKGAKNLNTLSGAARVLRVALRGLFGALSVVLLAVDALRLLTRESEKIKTETDKVVERLEREFQKRKELQNGGPITRAESFKKELLQKQADAFDEIRILRDDLDNVSLAGAANRPLAKGRVKEFERQIKGLESAAKSLDDKIARVDKSLEKLFAIKALGALAPVPEVKKGGTLPELTKEAKTVGSLRFENAQLEQLVAAAARGQDAVRALRQELELENAARNAGIKINTAIGQQFAEEFRKRQDLTAALEKNDKAQGLLNDRNSEGTSIIEAAQPPLERYQATYEKLSLALSEGRIRQGQFTEAVRDANIILEQHKQGLEQSAESARRFGSVFKDAFEDAIVEGKSLTDIIKGLEKELIRAFLLEFEVTSKGGLIDSIVKEVAGFLKGGKKDMTSLSNVGPLGTASTVEFDEEGFFPGIKEASQQLAGNFDLTSAASKIAGNALQTSAVDTLTAAAKTTFLAAAEDTAASSIFELAAAARVASAALNSVGASKGGGLGGLGGLFGGGEDFSLPFDSATDIAFGGPGFLDFAHGGRFTVRGPAGIDNLLTPLRLTAGERVTVETPAQQKANGQGTTIINNITMNITTPDSGGFRKSQNQIVADLQRALNRAQRIQ